MCRLLEMYNKLYTLNTHAAGGQCWYACRIVTTWTQIQKVKRVDKLHEHPRCLQCSMCMQCSQLLQCKHIKTFNKHMQSLDSWDAFNPCAALKSWAGLRPGGSMGFLWCMLCMACIKFHWLQQVWQPWMIASWWRKVIQVDSFVMLQFCLHHAQSFKLQTGCVGQLPEQPPEQPSSMCRVLARNNELYTLHTYVECGQCWYVSRIFTTWTQIQKVKRLDKLYDHPRGLQCIMCMPCMAHLQCNKWRTFS